MGYYTEFDGVFRINKPVDNETAQLIRGIRSTRRVARNIEGYGVEGEFYIGRDESNIINVNIPPKTQPGLWCDWQLDDDNQTIRWGYSDKFYDYDEWIIYLIEAILKPRGYIVNGVVVWRGEDWSDLGRIVITNNDVRVEYGYIEYH